MTLQIRPAVARDLPAVGQLHHRSRTAAYAGLLSAADLDAVPAAAMAQWWSERWSYERDTHRLRVGIDDGTLVGFSYVGPSETPGAVELYAIHVEPGLIGRGIGSALMAAARIDLTAVAGPEKSAVLWVLTGNVRARRFYEADGWRPDGLTRHAPIGATMVPQLSYVTAL